MDGDGRVRKPDDAPAFLKDIDLTDYEFQGDERYVAEALLGYILEQRTMYIEETPANPLNSDENVRSYQAVGIDWREMVMEIMAEDPQGINPYKAYGMLIMDGGTGGGISQGQ